MKPLHETTNHLVGEQVTRVWRLYLAGGALSFEQNRMGVDQVLAVRPDEHGDSGMPATPAEWAHGQWPQSHGQQP